MQTLSSTLLHIFVEVEVKTLTAHLLGHACSSWPVINVKLEGKQNRLKNIH